jgi:hypothetical protein
MKRGQVFARAQDETGRWGSADIFDLDEESFRAFIVGVLFRSGLVVGFKDELCAGQQLPCRTRPGFRFDEDAT